MTYTWINTPPTPPTVVKQESLERRTAFRLTVLSILDDLHTGSLSESGFVAACRRAEDKFGVNPACLFAQHPRVVRWEAQKRP